MKQIKPETKTHKDKEKELKKGDHVKIIKLL